MRLPGIVLLTAGVRRRKSRGLALEYFERRVLLSTFTVDNTADDGVGSLRWAILQVNADTTASTIDFDIPGSGVRTIALSSPLAPITHPVVIDGRSQPDYSGRPLVRLDGQALAGDQNGLMISAGGSTVAGLIITGFQGAGIVLTTNGGNLVESNTIGLDPAEFTATPNGDGVVILNASNNMIGGLASSAGNLISGNAGNGVKIEGTTLDTIGNQISGNFIGTTRDGLEALGNGMDGVLVSGGKGALIGGAFPGLGNVVSANGMNGLELNSEAVGTQITGNAIGLAADGIHAMGNLYDGVLLDSAPSTTIGGLTPDSANQISANHGSGVRTLGDTTGLVVQGNQIGTDATALLALGNFGDGLTIGSSSVMIGGLSQGAGNTIAYNGTGAVGAGVLLSDVVDGVSILSNSIHDNAGLGINIGDGPTPNHDPTDGPGPNHWQNYPILATALSAGGSTQLTGTLTAAASQKYTIQAFWSPQPDPSGFGEGAIYLGLDQATTDQTGQVQFTIPNLGGATPGGFLSVTATNASGDTSEFSPAVLLQPVSDLAVQITASPDPAPQGGELTFWVIVTNHGNLTAHHVALTAQLPSNLTIDSTSATQGTAPVVQGQSLSAELGSLAPGASAVVTIVGLPPSDFQGDVVVTAQTTMDEVDAHPVDDSASVSVHVAPTADLTLKLSDGPATAHMGDALSYDLTISNAGPASASNVVLTVPFPPIVSYVSATGTQGTGSLRSDRLIVSLGSIAPGAHARITVVLKATGLGTIASTASLTSDDYDPNPGDELASLSTTIRPLADLQVVMQAPTVAADGHNVVYGVTVSNAGPNDASAVTIQDVTPSLTTYVGASLENGGPVSFADGVVTANVGDLAVGASTTLWIVAVPSSAVGTTLTNTAHATSDEDDPNTTDNTASKDTPVRPVGDLAVVVTPSSPTVPRGQSVAFDVQVVNNGPSSEPNAVVAIPVPDWADLVSVSSTNGEAPTVADGVIVAQLDGLESGGSAHVTVVLAPKASATGALTASASVHGDDADFNMNDNAAVATVTLLPSSDLSVVVNPPSDPVHERSSFTYTVVVTANGPDDATGVEIRAALPSGVSFVNASSSQGAAPILASGAVVAQVGDLAAGDSATLTIQVKPTVGAGSSLRSAGRRSRTSLIRPPTMLRPQRSWCSRRSISPSPWEPRCLKSTSARPSPGGLTSRTTARRRRRASS